MNGFYSRYGSDSKPLDDQPASGRVESPARGRPDVRTYLERDLRQLSAVSSLPDFQRLMALAANRCARRLNRSDLARDAALPQPTAHRHWNLLEAGCLLVRLVPYTSNPTTGLVKGRKVLGSDCGLTAWLAGIMPWGWLAPRS